MNAPAELLENVKQQAPVAARPEGLARQVRWAAEILPVRQDLADLECRQPY
jgi:hypothetical protein